MSIWMPSIDPENSTPGTPGRLVIEALSVRMKSVGSAWMSRHWMPISLMRIGRKLGHLNASPVAEPTPIATPKPGLVTKVPSPRKAKLRPSPDSTSEPIFTSAPTATKLSSSSLSAAPVFRIRSVEVSVRNGPTWMRRVSTSNSKLVTRPFTKRRPRRMPSSFSTPPGSAVVRSVKVALIGLPGNSAPPREATKISPLNAEVCPKVTEKFSTPTRRSSNSSTPPKRILPPAPVVSVLASWLAPLALGLAGA